MTPYVELRDLLITALHSKLFGENGLFHPAQSIIRRWLCTQGLGEAEGLNVKLQNGLSRMYSTSTTTILISLYQCHPAASRCSRNSEPGSPRHRSYPHLLPHWCRGIVPLKSQSNSSRTLCSLHNLFHLPFSINKRLCALSFTSCLHFYF